MRVAPWSRGAQSTLPCVLLSMALSRFHQHPPVSLRRSNDVPVRSVQGHVRFDNTVDANPLVLARVALERDPGVSAHKAAPAVGADQIFATAINNAFLPRWPR